MANRFDRFDEREYYSDRPPREPDSPYRRDAGEAEYRRRAPPVREREREREASRGPDFLREDYGRTTAGPMVLRKRETDDVEYRPRPRARSVVDERQEVPRRGPDRDFDKDDVAFRSRSRSRGRAMSFKEQDEFVFRPREKSRQRVEERDEIVVRRGQGERPLPRERVEKDKVVIRRGNREPSRPPPVRDSEQIIIRREKDRSPSSSPSSSPSPEPRVEPQPEPPIIRAPPIHQEVITHHRHIDHGFEVLPPPRPMSAAPATMMPPPPPPPPPPPAPRSEIDESIEIRRRGVHRDGREFEDDIIIDRERGRPREDDWTVIPRRRSMSAPRRRPDWEERALAEEADYYNRKNMERAYMGEAYNGATRDWSIVDVPPGTKRVEMQGLGGGKEEITWQRYNGVRRSKFIAETDDMPPPPLPPHTPPTEEVSVERRRYVGVKSRTDNMWTEITKDLVIKDAIESLGYDYEETEEFFYIMEYLQYDDVERLVELSEDMRRGRRERIKEIKWERETLPLRPVRRPWPEEDKYVEREVVYTDRDRPRYR